MAINGELPEKEHTVDESIIDPTQVEIDEVASSASLSSLVKTHAVFQPFLVETYFEMSFSPLGVLASELGGDLPLTVVTFPDAIVQHSTNRERIRFYDCVWQYALAAVPLEIWPQVRKFFASLAGVVRANKEYRKVMPKEVRIKDTFFKATVSPNLLPEISICVYDIASNEKGVALNLIRTIPQPKFSVVFMEPCEECKRMADAFFADQPGKAVDIMGEHLKGA